MMMAMIMIMKIMMMTDYGDDHEYDDYDDYGYDSDYYDGVVAAADGYEGDDGYDGYYNDDDDGGDDDDGDEGECAAASVHACLVVVDVVAASLSSWNHRPSLHTRACISQALLQHYNTTMVQL